MYFANELHVELNYVVYRNTRGDSMHLPQRLFVRAQLERDLPSSRRGRARRLDPLEDGLHPPIGCEGRVVRIEVRRDALRGDVEQE